ncbi:lamin tail domain-containing protein [Haladaptatus sp. CMAA 1911]|uniref:lamin tail domain-containing protein n=1 Tax=unclassified Haladaptatus TaxID=2622732 RepID=UPI003754F495
MPDQKRRRFLLGAGTVVAGTVGLSSTSVFGASDESQLVFVEINDENEYLVVKNTSGEEMDLSGYIVDFGFEDDDEGDEQKGTIARGTTISAGGTLKIAPDAEQGEAGVEVSREYVMPDEEEEVYAILSPDGTVVARSDGDTYVGKPETTTTETEGTTTEDETTTEEGTTTEDDSEESASGETTENSDDDESGGDSSKDSQSDDDSESDEGESSNSGETGSEESGESSSEDDSEEDC